MLQITVHAADHLRQVRMEKGFRREVMPRFLRRSRRITLEFAERPIEGDRVVDSGAIAVLVAPSAADLFEAGTIDVGRTGDRPCLVVRRRRAQHGRLPSAAPDQTGPSRPA